MSSLLYNTLTCGHHSRPQKTITPFNILLNLRNNLFWIWMARLYFPHHLIVSIHITYWLGRKWNIILTNKKPLTKELISKGHDQFVLNELTDFKWYDFSVFLIEKEKHLFRVYDWSVSRFPSCYGSEINFYMSLKFVSLGSQKYLSMHWVLQKFSGWHEPFSNKIWP